MELFGQQRRRPAACPHSPNCVSTNAQDPSQAMPPLQYRLSEEQLRLHLRSIVDAYGRSRVVHEEQFYLRAEFRSTWLGFIDDVEFFIEPDSKTLHFRSASRKGYWDLGANRRRMEIITQRLVDIVGIEILPSA